eukprot:CAMPEP_0172642524 /NCGR_PEP_ID=MMETSP1068-20121228/232598_1 /TAXON_ID=35684 /ORGANISM="Pseudopedinella elastica, Strain CCMP716" /LENGTH=122 /DNA_ID=CAMNT_0013456367 /DNA_START=282 /DNA_END=648 /DNA_ORIENTATION=-
MPGGKERETQEKAVHETIPGAGGLRSGVWRWQATAQASAEDAPRDPTSARPDPGSHAASSARHRVELPGHSPASKEASATRAAPALEVPSVPGGAAAPASKAEAAATGRAMGRRGASETALP